MAQQAQTQPNGRTAEKTRQPEQSYSDLLEKALEQTAFPARVQGVKVALCRKAEDLERLLPNCMKGQADRLIQRAVMTLSGTETLQKVSDISFMRCVLKAAEMGLAIDGRLAYAVPFKTECTLIVSYMGLLAVARRTRVIRDCFARIVYEGESFDCGHENGKDYLSHKPSLDRAFTGVGGAIGAYAVVTLPDGQWRYEWMGKSEIARIQAVSKSGNIWAAWPTEMWKKTVIRRVLKNYAEDPGIQAMLANDDETDLPTEDIQPRRSALSRFEAQPETVKDDGEIVDSHSPRSAEEPTVEADNPVDALVLRIRKATTENQLVEATNAANAGGFGDDDRDFMLSEIDKRSNQLKTPKK